MNGEVIDGDALDVLRALPDGEFRCCITSPPYWKRSDYLVAPTKWGDGQVCALGKEPQFADYVVHLMEVLALVRPKLSADGSLWLIVQDGPGLIFQAMSGWVRARIRLPAEYLLYAGGPRDLDPVTSAVAPLQADGHRFGYWFGAPQTAFIGELLRACAQAGDRVLDPFGGPGALGLIAGPLGMSAVMIEADPGVARIGRERLAGM